MCGVPDATSGQAYKCTNVMSDSYTCMSFSVQLQPLSLTMTPPGGGCVKASPFGSPSTNGVNCHNIPNVDEVSCVGSKCFIHTCKSGFTASASNDGCVAKPDGKTARGFPAQGDDQVIDTATGAVHAVTREELSETIAPGSVAGNKVPRTDTTSGLTHTVLSDGKVSSNGAPLNVPHGIPTGTKLPREFAPFKGHGTDVVAEVAEKVGTNPARDVDVDE